MIKRALARHIFELSLKRHKMAFISGPRQVGKTTLARQIRSKFDQSQYKNWDQDQTAKEWAKNPELLLKNFDTKKVNQSKLLILDEIHKSKNWKTKIKGLYDTHSEELCVIVTGSASCRP